MGRIASDHRAVVIVVAVAPRQWGREIVARLARLTDRQRMKLLAPFRFLISPLSIAAINLLILWPLVLSVADLIESIRIHRDFNEAVDTVSTIAIVLIGWGVALRSATYCAACSGWRDALTSDGNMGSTRPAIARA